MDEAQRRQFASAPRHLIHGLQIWLPCYMIPTHLLLLVRRARSLLPSSSSPHPDTISVFTRTRALVNMPIAWPHHRQDVSVTISQHHPSFSRTASRCRARPKHVARAFRDHFIPEDTTRSSGHRRHLRHTMRLSQCADQAIHSPNVSAPNAPSHRFHAPILGGEAGQAVQALTRPANCFRLSQAPTSSFEHKQTVRASDLVSVGYQQTCQDPTPPVQRHDQTIPPPGASGTRGKKFVSKYKARSLTDTSRKPWTYPAVIREVLGAGPGSAMTVTDILRQLEHAQYRDCLKVPRPSYSSVSMTLAKDPLFEVLPEDGSKR
jgi:hypothetical protein